MFVGCGYDWFLVFAVVMVCSCFVGLISVLVRLFTCGYSLEVVYLWFIFVVAFAS